MGFVRKHLFVLACALGAAAGVGLAALGMTRGSAVVEGLREGQQLAGEFDRFNRPDNERAVDQMNRQLERLRSAEAALLEEAARINRCEPLVAGLFPSPEGEGAKYEFLDAYRKEVDRWLAELHAAGPLSREELSNWKRMIEEERNALRKGETPQGFANVDQELLAGLPQEMLEDHEARAAIWQARHAYCYAEPASFDLSPSVYRPRDSTPPSLDTLWSAQVGMWVQQDIVNAIIAINNTRAEEIGRSGKSGADDSPWVGNLPIKQIVGIKITDYLFAEDEKPPAEYKPLESVYQKRGFAVSADVGLPETDVHYALTGHGGTDEYDVMHLRVVLVADPRFVPVIIDEILGRNLYTLLNVRYRHLPIATDFSFPIYGPDPTIQLELGFAIHWMTNIYAPLMPEETKKALGLGGHQE